MYNIFRSAYILKQDSLPPSYKSFLNKHGGKAAVTLQGVKEIACGMPLTDLKVIEKHYKTMGVDVKLNPQMKVPCSVCILVLIQGFLCTNMHISVFLLCYQKLETTIPVNMHFRTNIPKMVIFRT